MTDSELEAMRALYAHATLDRHILVGGAVFLRCPECKERPVPAGWSALALCDPCLSAVLARTEPRA